MLYIIATPIGNLEDITRRALRILEEVDYILTEDTRKTGVFLQSLSLPKKRLLSFYEHNEEQRTSQVIEDLKEGKNIALVCGAGTPLISDPGFKLIKKCIEEKIDFTSVGGASAVLNGLVLSGLAPDSFLFCGFLPKKTGKRIKKIGSLKEEPYTLIIFESPFRILKTLSELKEVLGNRKCCLCREMTKIHEEAMRGNFSELIEKISLNKLKGECTIVVEGQKKA